MFEFILAIIILGFAVLAWTNPRTASLLILATLPAYLVRFEFGSLPMTLLEIMLLIVIVIWLIRFRDWKKLTRDFRWPVALFIIASTIAIFVAPDKLTALGIWKSYFIEPILFYFVLRSQIKNEGEANQAVMALGVGALLVALFAILQKFTGLAIPEAWDLERRITSVFPYPNAVGLYLAPIIVLGFTALGKAFHRTEIYTAYFWMLTLALSLTAIILSKTEAAWVALTATLGLMALISKWTRWWALPLTIITTAVILLVPAIRGPVFEKLTLQDYSGSIRRVQWAETVEFLGDQPIFGAGLNGYPVLIVPYHSQEHIEIFQYPHNIFLNTWVELGALGLLALLVLTLACLRVLYRGRDPDHRINWLFYGTAGALLVMFIHGLVDVPYFKNDLAVLTWVILALFSLSTSYEITRKNS